MAAGPAPVPFITYDAATDKFAVAPEGARRLQAVKGKMSVVCVAGPYRTGKSFLLNRLIGQQKGFAVGGTVKACTKGIWLWGDPVVEDGKTFVFLDTEGLGSIEAKSTTFDTQIFSLAVLLGSYFILNTQGTINENALEQLQLVVNVARQIKVREDAGRRGATGSEGELGMHFPHFLWVLRDFVLSLEGPEGQPITSRDYLEDALRQEPNKRDDPRVTAKNAIRSTLTSVFQHRDCETLVRPVMDEKQLQKAHELDYNKLRKEFRDAMAHLREKVIRTAPLKQMGAAFVNGPALVRLAEQYVEALNTGAVPTIQSAWASVVAVQCREALDKATDHYALALQRAFLGDKSAVVESARLTALNETATAEAFNILHENAVGDDAEIRELDGQLRKRISDRYADAVQQNEMRSRLASQRIADEAWAAVGGDRALKKARTPEDIARLLDAFKAAADKKAGGPNKAEIVREFAERKYQDQMTTLLEEMAALEREKKELNAALTASRAEMDSLNINFHKTTTQLESANADKKQLRDEIAELRAEVKRLSSELASLQRENPLLTSKLEAAKGEASKLGSQLNEQKVELLRLEKELRAAEKEGKTAEKRAQSAEGERNKSEDALRKQITTLEKQLEELETSKTKLVTDSKKEAGAADKELRAAQVKVTKLEQQVEELEDDKAKLASKSGKDAAAAEKEVKAAQAKIAKLEERVAELEEQRKQPAKGRSGATADELETRINTQNEEIRRLNDQLIDAKLENRRLHDDFAAKHTAAPPSTKKRKRDDEEDDTGALPESAPKRARVDAPPQPPAAAVEASESTEEAEERAGRSTIQQLKSWLTELNVDLPPTAENKQFYLNLLYESHPALAGRAPPQTPARTRKRA